MKAARYAEGLEQDFVDHIVWALPYASFEAAEEFYASIEGKTLKNGTKFEGSQAEAFLAANDRFYLLTVVLRRHDALHEWVYDRCREVEADPDDRLDLWARYHYKSTIITFAGSIQEIIDNPEVTIAIFANTGKIAHAFLDQIKRELEDNDHLKKLYPDVLWESPRKESPGWSSEGIIVKRKGNPKEATVEAHGVLDALPTSRHYDILDFDDLVTENSVTNTDSGQIAKTTNRFELAQSLGHGHSKRRMAGTRYSYADTYGVLIERQTVIPRVYAATRDGTLNGAPVLLTPEKWDEIKRDQRGVVAAQMLLNPLAGQANTFYVDHLRSYEIRPRELSVYIIGDPAGKPRSAKSKNDRTALAVIGIDVNENRYLLDGYCHRMKLSDRWANLRNLFVKWKAAPYIQFVRVAYERYGMQSDDEYFEEKIYLEKIDGLSIDEVSWAREGGQSKTARISRLEPYFKNGQFFIPPKVLHPDLGVCTWRIKKTTEPLMLNGAEVLDKKTGAVIMVDVPGSAEIVYAPVKGATKAEVQARQRGELFRIMEPIKRIDEDGNVYDLTRMLFEEYRLHPFAPHDDLIDAMSRIQDVQPTAPKIIDQRDIDGPSFVDT